MKSKKGKIVLGILIGVLAFVLVCGGGLLYLRSQNKDVTVAEEEPEKTDKKKKDKDNKDDKEDKDDIKIVKNRDYGEYERKLMTVDFKGADPSYTPSVEAYSVEPDLSNVTNLGRFYLQDDMKQAIADNCFVVVEGWGDEFFDIYEDNRYDMTPNFVTTDSMMHTYHLYYSTLQKNTEINFLSDDLKKLSEHMFDKAVAMYDECKGTDWEDAAKVNVEFFAVGAKLMGNDIDVPDYADHVEDELHKIEAADAIRHNDIFNVDEDYSQYVVRGYYESTPQLQGYFKAMMWFGRCNFTQKEEKLNKAALLMNLCMDEDALASWDRIYSVTAFFAGASDDSGYYEYMPVIEQSFGTGADIADIIDDKEGYKTYKKLTAEMEPPKINSMVFADDEGETDKTEMAKGYRFMGQRFTLDAAIFTQLCYSKVMTNPQGNKRMLPDALDVPAAMGSDMALGILEENGNAEYENYSKNMDMLRDSIANAPDTLWSASLYGGWLNTLNPLLVPKGNGYPSFMTNDEWTKKDLVTFLGSWTELKHDSILYSKQFMAEMGGGWEEEIDDRGYVEPEPELFARLAKLTADTSAGLDKFGILSDQDRKALAELSSLSDDLKDIAIKELTNEALTDDDYELIRCMGGNLEHFWEMTIDKSALEDSNYAESSNFPAALVADVATDPNGAVLEEAIGRINVVYVVFPIDGELHLGKGAVYSYYQFEVPISERMTDSQWKRKLGMELNDNMEYDIPDKSIRQPEWTDSFTRYHD
ncbi:MAG: DUF3160 domain-containing protein [Lachnospiraceae bacterium]|nr:DUF3160 domain-containing protein [Lachnospiraceae bacterium]